MGIEEENGVHSKENYPHNKAKPTHERYGEHIKMDESNAIADSEIVDINKTGKVQDITSGEFERKEKHMNDK